MNFPAASAIITYSCLPEYPALYKSGTNHFKDLTLLYKIVTPPFEDFFNYMKYVDCILRIFLYPVKYNFPLVILSFNGNEICSLVILIHLIKKRKLRRLLCNFVNVNIFCYTSHRHIILRIIGCCVPYRSTFLRLALVI